MSETKVKCESESIASAFVGITDFCKSVSLLLKSGEVVFNGLGYESAQPQKDCVYSGSTSLDKPEKWLPYLFYRSFRPEARDDVVSYLAVIIDIAVHPSISGSAYFTTGTFVHDQTWKTPSGNSTNLFRWHTLLKDPDFSGAFSIRKTDEFVWRKNGLHKKWSKFTNGITLAISNGIALHELKNADQLKTFIVELHNESSKL